MKKIILFLFIAASFGACKNESKEIKEAEKNTVEMIPEDTLTVENAPTFESADAREYVASYDAFLAEYSEAVASKDQVKLQEINSRMIELSAKGTEVLKGLSGEDATKLAAYMTKRGEEFAKISAQNK